MSSEKKVSKSPRKGVTRREFLKAGLGAGGLAVLAGCAPAATPTPTKAPLAPTPTKAPPAPTTTPVPKKTMLRVGLGQTADWLSPNALQRAPMRSVYFAMYESLTWVDRATGEVRPMLAKSWRVLDDHLTWEFELQEGVKFHNEEEFDAESVKVTFDYILTEKPPSTPGHRVAAAGIKSVEIVDKYKVRIVTEEPYVILPAALNEIHIYPAKHFSKVGPEGFAQDPMGTGKYRLKRWDKGLKTVLEKFEDHWGWGEPALVDEIEFRGYPEDSTRVSALRADEADMIFNLPPDEAKGIEAEGFKVQWTPIAQAMVLHMTPREGNPFMDKRVRQAISYGIDVDSLIENVMLGYAKKLNGQVTHPGIFGYNPNLEPYPYDPDKARELLKEAGYPDGFSIDFNISQGRYAKQKEMNEALAGQLAKIGIECKLNMLEWAVFVDRLLVKYDPSPLVYVGWNYFVMFDADAVCQHFLSTDIKKLFTIAPKEADEAIEKSRLEFDPKKRETYLHEFNAIMREEAPCVFLFQAPDIFGVQPRVKNLKPTPDNGIHFEGIYIEE